MIAFQQFKEINELEDIHLKHRAWLKLHEGLKYGRGIEGHYMKGEEWTKTKYKDLHYDASINLVGRLPNQLRIEFDGEEKKAKEHLEQTILFIKEKKWGYIRSTHNGKCDYVWVEFNKDMKDKELKIFLEWIAPEGSIIDENFASSEKIFPCMWAVHWKHSYQRELPVEFVDGEQIDFDSLKIQNPKGKRTFAKSEDFTYANFAKASRIFSDKMEAASLFYDKQPIYYDEGGNFWLWNFENKAWKMIDETDLMNFIYNVIGINTISAREKSEILQALKQIGRMRKPQALPKTWIQFKNGIIDITDGCVLREATKEYFTVHPIPWNIGKGPETPNMDKIFREWVGDAYVKTLYQILAYCLLPDYPLHRIFCLIGGGMNGKSKFLELLRKFVGNHNVASTELDTLIHSRFETARLYKKLAVQMGETDFNEITQTSKLKQLSGGDLVGFEYKNKNLFEDKSYAKIIISTNNLPTTSDKTVGFYRRWLLIDFPNQFTEKKDILQEIPDEEYENLAFKSIFMLNELLEVREFHNEGTIEERAKRYEDHSDPLEKFLKEYTVEDQDGDIWKFEFENMFNQWCAEHKHRQFSEVAIGKKMKEKGINQALKMAEWLIDGQHKRLRIWNGIKWR
jgi:P4 family phage/plasmid primase-like protien